MTKDELVRIITKLLAPDDTDLDFLQELTEDDLATLVGCIRERVQPTDKDR